MSPRELLRELPAAVLTLLIVWAGFSLFILVMTP